MKDFFLVVCCYCLLITSVILEDSTVFAWSSLTPLPTSRSISSISERSTSERSTSILSLLSMSSSSSPQQQQQQQHYDEQQQQQQQQQYVIPVPYCGERALQSAGMAKTIRDLRSNRGRPSLEQAILVEPTSTSDAANTIHNNDSNSSNNSNNSTSTSTKTIIKQQQQQQQQKEIKTNTNTNTTTSRTTALVFNQQQQKKQKQKNAAPHQIFTYASVLQVLRAYHALHNNLILPRRYIVPADATHYSPEWHGVDLSSHIYTMAWWSRHVRQHPDRVTELTALGFCWERLQPEWNLILEALITYSSLHNHNNGNVLLVPVSFVVPYHSNDWPRATWGLSLGHCVHRMRLRHDFLKCPTTGPARRSQLNGLGFVWDVAELRFHKFCAAWTHFHIIEGHGSNGSKSRTTNGSHGSNSNAGECQGKKKRRRQQQQSLLTDQSYSMHDNPTTSTTTAAAAMTIPSTFVVPSDDTWPRGLWDYPLGAKCVAIRQKGLYGVNTNPERRQRLNDLHFSWTGNAARGWYQVVHAAAIYSQLHHCHLNVPIAFVVPAPPQIQSHNVFYVVMGDNNNNSDQNTANDAWPWPQQLWGFPLGQRLKDVRLKGAYLKGKDATKRRAQLDALGFNWTPKRGRQKRN